MVAPFRSFRSVSFCSGIFSIYINACCAAFKYAPERDSISVGAGGRGEDSRCSCVGSWLLSTCVTCHFGLGANSPVSRALKNARTLFTRVFSIFHFGFFNFVYLFFPFPFFAVFFRFFLAVSRIRFAYFSRLLTNLIYLRLVCFSFCSPLLSPLHLFRSFYALLSLPVLITHNARIYLTLAIYTARY